MSAAERLDTATLGRLLLQPWRDLLRRPALAWLAPQPAVRLLHADGSQSLWQGEQRRNATARELQAAAFAAIEWPADQVLDVRVPLPPTLTATDREAALALQAGMASPFEPADLVWGARAGTTAGEWVMLLASRKAVQARLDTVDAIGHKAPEVWAFAGDGRPVVLRGFGEAARQQRSGRGRGLAAALVLLAMLLLLAILVTPALQMRWKAQQAERAQAELQARLAPVLAERERLATAQAQLQTLRDLAAERIDPLAVLNRVTQAVPDDSWVQRLQIQGARVTITGQTPNASALMNRLSSQPEVSDVKAPAPATRSIGGRENYTIEFTLTPAALRPAAPAAAASMTAAAQALPDAGASAPAASAAAAAPAASSAAAPAPPAPAASAAPPSRPSIFTTGARP